MESSSSSELFGGVSESKTRKRIRPPRELPGGGLEKHCQPVDRTASIIIEWAQTRNVQRLRADRQVGLPEKEHLTQWAAILERWDLVDEHDVFSVFDAARGAADRSGPWRNWAFLTLQVQLSAERFREHRPRSVERATPKFTLPSEESSSIWAKAKLRIRSQIPETAYLNWFSCTRQIVRSGSRVDVAVPDETTGAILNDEYQEISRAALSDDGVNEIRFIVAQPPSNGCPGLDATVTGASDIRNEEGA